MTGSTPSCITARLPARLPRRATALWQSVTLAASIQSLSRRALRRIGSTVALRGGPISAVTANRPRRRVACRRLYGPSSGGRAGPEDAGETDPRAAGATTAPPDPVDPPVPADPEASG